MFPPRVVFMGTPSFAVPALQALRAGGYDVAAVYTRAPQPRGRGHHVQKTPVHEVGEGAGVPVFTPKTLRTPEVQAAFVAHKADVCVVAAYGLLLPPPVLDGVRVGCLNLHASLLPRWRGAAPLQRAILAGDAESGVCLMRMEEGLDTGPVYARTVVPLGPETTALSLESALAEAGAQLVVQHLPAILAGTLRPTPQPEEGVLYAAKLGKAESALAWTEPADVLARKIRAFTPWPGAFLPVQGEALKVLAADVCPFVEEAPPGTLLADDFTVACGTGALKLLTVQRPGRGPVEGAACLRGWHLSPGACLAPRFPAPPLA